MRFAVLALLVLVSGCSAIVPVEDAESGAPTSPTASVPVVLSRPLEWDGATGTGACAPTPTMGCYGVFVEDKSFLYVGGNATLLRGNLTWGDPMVPELQIFVMTASECEQCPYGWLLGEPLASAQGTSPLFLKAGALVGDWGLYVQVPGMAGAQAYADMPFRFEGQFNA